MGGGGGGYGAGGEADYHTDRKTLCAEIRSPATDTNFIKPQVKESTHKGVNQRSK